MSTPREAMGNREKHAPLTEGPIIPTLARLSGQMLVGILGMIAFSLVDTYFVGQLGPDELAAMGYVLPVAMVVMGLSSGDPDQDLSTPPSSRATAGSRGTSGVPLGHSHSPPLAAPPPQDYNDPSKQTPEESPMVRTILCAFALIMLAATPMACNKDSGGGGGQDTLVPLDTAPDTAPPLDAVEDSPPPPEDSLADTPPPPEDIIEDISWDNLQDISWDNLEDISWDLPWNTMWDAPEDISWDTIEDISCDISEDIPDIFPDVPCEWPPYSENCADIPYFQCGFMGFCEDGVLTAEWHEHIFCAGEEHIVDYWCEHACDCKDGDIIDWPDSGAAFVDGYCKAEPGCDMPPLYASVSLPDLLGDLPAYDGQKVGFVGHVLIGNMMCGDVKCDPGDPCCQPCGASYEVTGPSSAIELTTGLVTPVGCSGNNCTVMDNCAPFPTADADYLLWGTVEAVFSFGALHLDGWCSAP